MLRVLVLLGLACAALAASAAPADDIKALLEQGRASEAYELGRKTPEALGDPAFDFYFGIAATDSGHAGEGVLALERYLLNFPDNRDARLELARAYFVLGEDQRAREEFEALAKAGPAPGVAAAIQRYLDAIRLRETRYTPTGAVWLEAGIGTDSNVNAGVNDPSITLPLLGPVTVTPNAVRASDSFSLLTAGGFYSRPVAPGVALFGTGQVDAKTNATQHAFDQMLLAGAAGVSVLRERNLFRLSYNLNSILIESDRYRTSSGITGEWNRQLDEFQSLNAVLQGARFKYAGANSVRDADYFAAGLGYRRVFIGSLQPVLNVSASAGRESVLAADRDDLSRDLLGARLALALVPAERWGLSAGYSFQRADSDAPDAILGVTRRDRYRAVDMAASYLVSRALSVRAEWVSSKNASNVALYEYKRDYFALKLRYEFK